MWTDNKDEQNENNGNNGDKLVSGYTYSILAVKEHKGTKLLQLRNPWSNFEWSGDYSNQSDLWTQDLIDAMKPTFD